MRPTTLAIALACLATAASAARKPAGQAGGQFDNNSVVGGNAQTAYYNPGGYQSPAKGTVTYYDSSNDARITADIDCVSIQGSTTYFSGLVKVASRAARLLGIMPGYSYLWGMIVDLAEPEEDIISIRAVDPGEIQDPASLCESYVEAQTHELDNGNIQVDFVD